MNWNSVGVISKPFAAEQNLAICQELHRLLTEWKIKTYFDTAIGKLLNLPSETCCDPETLMQKSDLILVAGGDGSMLSASRRAVKYGKPVLGINRGKLGFLTDISPEELSSHLQDVLQGHFWTEQRFLLEGEIIQDKTSKITHTALNDIVLSLGASSQLIEFDLWINDTFVCRQRADGLIITTPTGSTAYSLSAGGPILHPALNAIAIVPMLPHKLTSRPIVISNDADIKIILKSEHQGPARVSFDSQNSVDLEINSTIHIKQFAQKLNLIHPKSYDYFKTLRDKLHWESR